MSQPQYVKWTSTDQDGEFSHVGQLIADGDVFCLRLVEGGLIEIPVGDGTITPCKCPPKTFKPAAAAPAQSAPKPHTQQKQPGGKIAAIIELLRAHAPSSRKAAIQLIVDAGISTPAGASTMYNTAKKLI